MKTSIKVGQVFRHYKGRHYTVVFISFDANTQIPIISYEDKNGLNTDVWALPEPEFIKQVPWNGEMVNRFEEIVPLKELDN